MPPKAEVRDVTEAHVRKQLRDGDAVGARQSALSSAGRRSMKLLLGPKMNSLVSVGLKLCVKESTPLRPGRGKEIGESGKFKSLAKLP